MFGRDANLIVSVRSPVGTGVPKIGQRIKISDITFGPSGWLVLPWTIASAHRIPPWLLPWLLLRCCVLCANVKLLAEQD